MKDFLSWLVIWPMVLALTAAPALAQESKGGRLRAPVAKASVVNAVRGVPVEIVMEGTTSTSRALVFALRRRPDLGTFAEQEPVPMKPAPGTEKGRGSAVLHYTASPDQKGDRDSFTFTCKLDGGPSSNDATVTILIKDALPVLKLPGAVDMGRQVLGRPAEQSFPVRNDGTGLYQAVVPAPPGFMWKQPAGGAFLIPPGESVEATLVADTARVAVLGGQLEFMTGSVVRCAARVVPLFSVIPSSSLELKWDAATKTRTGRLSLQNNTDEKLSLEITQPRGIKAPAAFSLEPGGSQPLNLTADAPLTEAVKGEVSLSAGLQREVIPCHAQVAPALLEATGYPESGHMEFGKLTALDQAEQTQAFTLRNHGGTAAELLAAPLPRVFRMEAAGMTEGALSIPPGTEVKLSFRPGLQPVNTREEEIAFTGPGFQKKLKLTAQWDAALIPGPESSAAEAVLLERMKSEPSRNQEGPSVQQSKVNTQIALTGALIADGSESLSVPCIDKATLSQQDDHTMTIHWDLPPGDGWNFRILQAQVLRPTETEPLRKIWAPYAFTNVIVAGRTASAKIEGLIPGRGVNFAIQTLAPDGRKSFPGKYIVVMTLIPPPSRWEWWAGGTLALLLLGWWLWRKWKEPINRNI